MKNIKISKSLINTNIIGGCLGNRMQYNEYSDITNDELYENIGIDLNHLYSKYYSDEDILRKIRNEIRNVNECKINTNMFRSFIAFCMLSIKCNSYKGSDFYEKKSLNNLMCEPYHSAALYRMHMITQSNTNSLTYLVFEFDILPHIILNILKQRSFSLLAYVYESTNNKIYVEIERSCNLELCNSIKYKDFKEKYTNGMDFVSTTNRPTIRHLLKSIPKKYYSKCNMSYYFETEIFDNGLDTLSEKDSIKCWLAFKYSVGVVPISKMMYAFDNVAYMVVNGSVSMKELYDFRVLIYRCFTNVPSTKSEMLDNASRNFLNQLNFYKDFNLNYSRIDAVYKVLQDTPSTIIERYDARYINTNINESESHFIRGIYYVKQVNFDYERFADKINLFRDFLITKFNRSMKEEILRKLFVYSSEDLEAITFTKNTINSIKSVNWGNPCIIRLALYYDLSHLELEVRLYLNYYIDDNDILDDLLPSNLLKYIISNGNSMRKDNLKMILMNLKNVKIYKFANIEDIRREIIDSEIDFEKEDAESEYEFDFDKDSICDLVDNPISKNGIKMYLMDTKDQRVFILGKLTRCCYHMGSAAEACMIYSIIAPNSGNVVIEDVETNKILGTAWVWYDKENDIYVFDNFEFVKDSEVPNYIDIIEEYSMGLPYANVHVGLSYNSIMGNYFKMINPSMNERCESEKVSQAKFTNIDDFDEDIYSDYINEEFSVIKSNGVSMRNKKKTFE